MARPAGARTSAQARARRPAGSFSPLAAGASLSISRAALPLVSTRSLALLRSARSLHDLGRLVADARLFSFFSAPALVRPFFCALCNERFAPRPSFALRVYSLPRASFILLRKRGTWDSWDNSSKAWHCIEGNGGERNAISRSNGGGHFSHLKCQPFEPCYGCASQAALSARRYHDEDGGRLSLFRAIL